MKISRIIAGAWFLLSLHSAACAQEPILERRPLTFEALQTQPQGSPATIGLPRAHPTNRHNAL
jgi:hypothetical protein